MTTETISALLQRATAAIEGVSDSARLDAELLLADCLKVDRSHFYAWPDKAVEPVVAERFAQAIDRRVQGEPLAYITGYREFWSLRFKVTTDTLIPRPETELLVELAIELLDKNPAPTGKLLDLGTGSGAIAISIALERPNTLVHATDNSTAALDIAKDNATRLGARVTFHQSDWLQDIPVARYQLIVSNPPYIDPDDPHLFDLRYEPQQALIAGSQGLADIAAISHQALAFLDDAGWLLLEHGADQGDAVRVQLQRAGYKNVNTLTDLEGRDRVTRGQKITASVPL